MTWVEGQVEEGELSENAERSFWAEGERVTCPALLVLAQRSYIPGQEVEEMLRRRSDTMVVGIPGAGHDLHLERPDALHDVLRDLLAALSIPGGAVRVEGGPGGGDR